MINRTEFFILISLLLVDKIIYCKKHKIEPVNYPQTVVQSASLIGHKSEQISDSSRTPDSPRKFDPVPGSIDYVLKIPSSRFALSQEGSVSLNFDSNKNEADFSPLFASGSELKGSETSNVPLQNDINEESNKKNGKKQNNENNNNRRNNDESESECHDGFSVRKSRRENLKAKTKVLFEEILTNAGGWDSENQEFVARCTGIFFFSFNAVSEDKIGFTMALMKNGKYQVTAYGGKEDYQWGGNSAMLFLNPGDRVWLELQDGQIYEHPFEEAYTTFTGFLVKNF